MIRLKEIIHHPTLHPVRCAGLRGPRSRTSPGFEALGAPPVPHWPHPQRRPALPGLRPSTLRILCLFRLGNFPYILVLGYGIDMDSKPSTLMSDMSDHFASKAPNSWLTKSNTIVPPGFHLWGIWTKYKLSIRRPFIDGYISEVRNRTTLGTAANGSWISSFTGMLLLHEMRADLTPNTFSILAHSNSSRL